MLQELFVNACILITTIFITSQIFRNSGINPKSRVEVRTMFGVFGGLSACILIYFSIDITSEVVLDFRDICLILVAIFGGIFPSLVSGIITAAFRLTYNGINQNSVIASIGILVVSIGCGVFSSIKIDIKTKIKILLFYSLLIHSLVYCIILEDKRDAISIILGSWLSTILLGLGVYYLVQYLVAAHRLLKDLKKESSMDFLTGLSNTRQFDRKYNAVIQDVLVTEQKLSLLIIDIDHFKKVNDTYGHIAGDAVLKELGKILKASCKENYLLSRIGGEEFAVVLRDLIKEEVVIIAERIRKAVETQPFTLPNNKKIKITISIGAAIYPNTVDNINDLRELADKKLYEAKWSGRNRVCI